MLRKTKTAKAILKVWTDPPTSRCILWRGAKDGKGYGRVKVNGKQERIHRVIYPLMSGIPFIPNEKCVLHTCDRPACYNPLHLFLGTRADNVKDMISKGRGWWQKKRGTKTLT